jgi:hypothetical protein
VAFPTTESHIEAAERELGVRLPREFRERLVARNGGELTTTAGDDWQVFPVFDSTNRKTASRSAGHIVLENRSARGGKPSRRARWRSLRTVRAIFWCSCPRCPPARWVRWVRRSSCGITRRANACQLRSGMKTRCPLRSNTSFDADTQRHCAAKRAGERMPRGAMPLRAGQLQR